MGANDAFCEFKPEKTGDFSSLCNSLIESGPFWCLTVHGQLRAD